MTKLLRTTSLAATLAALTLAAAPANAQAVGPTDRNATATARIIKPLTLTHVQDLDLGTILLSGAGAWTGEVVSIDHLGTFSCSNVNVTCSGATQVASYNVTGTNRQTVTINAPDVTLVNQNDNTQTLLMEVSCPGSAGTWDCPGSVALPNSGNTGVPFDLGGRITVNSTTLDGVYLGTFNVTVEY